MAKEEKVKIPERQKSFFPKKRIWLSLILLVVGIVNFFKSYAYQSEIANGLIIFAGLALLRTGVDSGFSKKRKEILKKYI
jgi:hypothetical protein